jgi:hypothetical protein
MVEHPRDVIEAIEELLVAAPPQQRDTTPADRVTPP